ncbi:MAG TPA: chemotaxis protein CheW [Mobilitalea sp.]|nr:chemotaxis protein CheW [Mobilitalea sp.]
MDDMQLDLTEEDTQKGRYLIFTIDKESYGIEIKYVTEIIGIQSITRVPEMPEYIKGIINLRGKIIPVIDVRLRFNKESNDYSDRTCIIVVDIREMSVGLIVDSVSEVASINDDDISELPHINKDNQNRFVKNIGKLGNEVRLLLDCHRLLTDEDLDALKTL